MITIARHYIDEPPDEEPPFGWCPSCDGPLIDAHECRCGWNEYEAIKPARDDAMEKDHRRRGGEG